MGELKNTTNLVFTILQQDTAATDSDILLYGRVPEHNGKENGRNFTRGSVDSWVKS